LLFLCLIASFLSLSASAVSIATHPVSKTSKEKHAAQNAHAQHHTASATHGHKLVRASAHSTVHSRQHHYYERFSASSFAEGQTEGDIIAGEDPVVRQAAIDALGNMNGTVVAIDPSNGRILAMVNQKLALSAGAEPCSTIKVPVALAALSENIITKDTKVPLAKYWSMDLTEALAHSNNAYFETVGRRLGFEKYSYYARQFGLGELAGWNIANEHLGIFPNEPLDEKLGGVGKMCSFGESISMTPLQLGALMSAVANGGTLYYLQHPQTQEEAVSFEPKVKRHLDIADVVPQMEDGMAGAVQYGTARALHYTFSEEQVMGKTGTCSNAGTRYGWFASFANTEHGRVVAVVFLEGGRPTYGGKAADVAGHLYRELYDHSFFGAKPVLTPASLTTGGE
jgi:cell division protein FtsI/penicillin-binding protein 2